MGFSSNSFDVGLALNSGKISSAVAVGASWTESYIMASLVYSSKIENIFYAINFKLAIKHWLSLTAAILCCIVPQLVPIATYIVKIIGSAASTAKPILIAALPLLLGV